jgi:hypothetical protein
LATKTHELIFLGAIAVPMGGAREGAGRPKGSPNKFRTEEGMRLVTLARRHSAAAIRTLATIMTSKTAPESARVSAAVHLLDRG